MIQINNLTKTYNHNGTSKNVFSNVHLYFKKGDRVGLFGHNGKGKTTLLNIIAGLDKDYQGNVRVVGTTSYVYQNPTLTLAPWFTSEQNILSPAIYQKLDLSKTKDFLRALCATFEINFPLTQYPDSLSGGQRQLVTLLQVLITRPNILLLDEPFSALDKEKRIAVLKHLQKHISKNTTVIISSHREDEIKPFTERTLYL